MIGRIFADRKRLAATRRVDRLAAVVHGRAAGGGRRGGLVRRPGVAGGGDRRYSSLLGGIAAVWRHRPDASELGLSRYAMPAAAGIAATLFGRFSTPALSLLLVPLVAVLLWAITTSSCASSAGPAVGRCSDLLLMWIAFSGRRGPGDPLRAARLADADDCWWRS